MYILTAEEEQAMSTLFGDPGWTDGTINVDDSLARMGQQQPRGYYTRHDTYGVYWGLWDAEAKEDVWIGVEDLQDAFLRMVKNPQAYDLDIEDEWLLSMVIQEGNLALLNEDKMLVDTLVSVAFYDEAYIG